MLLHALNDVPSMLTLNGKGWMYCVHLLLLFVLLLLCSPKKRLGGRFRTCPKPFGDTPSRVQVGKNEEVSFPSKQTATPFLG